MQGPYCFLSSFSFQVGEAELCNRDWRIEKAEYMNLNQTCLIVSCRPHLFKCMQEGFEALDTCAFILHLHRKVGQCLESTEWTKTYCQLHRQNAAKDLCFQLLFFFHPRILQKAAVSPWEFPIEWKVYSVKGVGWCGDIVHKNALNVISVHQFDLWW